MAKKCKKKNYKNKKAVTDVKLFIQDTCSKCQLCGPVPQPSFCYNTAYLSDRKKFDRKIKRTLLEYADYIFDIYKNNKDCPDHNLQALFTDCFCQNKPLNECPKKEKKRSKCPHYEVCYECFTSQMNLEESATADRVPRKANLITSAFKRKRKERHKNKLVAVAKFFCNAGFEKTIEEILTDPNLR